MDENPRKELWNLFMEKMEYNKRVNKMVITCWAIISIVLSIAYCIEIVKGLRSISYVMLFCFFSLLPLGITAIANKIYKGTNLNIKYFATIGYIIFYTFSLLTTQERVSFVYIIPMVSILIVYCDARIISILYGYAILINGIKIFVEYTNGHNSNSDITFYEIQITCLLLSAMFMIQALSLVKQSITKMFELQRNVVIDELSNAYNRKFITTKILPEFEHAKTVPGFSLAYIDIDNFKDFNTKYGHEFGDRTIKFVSKLVMEQCEKCEKTYFIRIGGDEFILISNGLKFEDFQHLCKSIKFKVERNKMQHENKDVDVTISMGIANTIYNNVDNFDTLQYLADEQLYNAKNSGKNAICISDVTN